MTVTKKNDKPEPMGTVTVTVSLSDYIEGNFESYLVGRVASALEGRISEHISRAVEARVLELCNQEFKKLAAEKLDDYFKKPHRKTNTWGDPIGESTTLREILAKRFDDYLNERVDEKGNTSTYSRDQLTRAQWMLNTLAHKPLTDAVNETVSKIAAKAKEQVQASVSRYIAEQLAPTISVPQLKQ